MKNSQNINGRSSTFSGLVVATVFSCLASAVLADDPTAADLGLMDGFNPADDKIVDSTNWIEYPFNRWGFQNIRRILPTAKLVSSPSTIIPFQEDKQNLDQVEVDLDKGGVRTVEEIMEAWQTDSIVVLHNGKLVYERYWNGMSPSQPHWVASVSKSYIGTFGAMLVERGVLDRNGLVSSYVPELTGSGFANATVGQILDMTAGTAWDESPAAFADPDSPARQYGAASGSIVIPGVRGIGVAGFLPTIEQDRPHGEIFVYNSPQVDVMGWIIENVTGRSLIENINAEIWSKLGAECDANYILDARGVPWATGGISACARDLARFGQMMLNGGHFGGQRIVPDSIITNIRTLGDANAFAKGPRADTYPEGAYRDYWWITNNPDGAYLAKGVFGQLIYINPKARVVISRHASEKEASNAQKTVEVETAFQAIADYLSQ